MRTIPLRTTNGSFLQLATGLVIIFALCSVSFGHSSNGSESAGGIIAYYGIVPSEVVGTHAPDHAEATMHGGVPSNKQSHHIVVALFEQRGFERITDAKVSATVAESGLDGETKPLQAFTINDSLTYGNYFNFSRGKHYQITVSVRVPGKVAAVTFQFEYEHM